MPFLQFLPIFANLPAKKGLHKRYSQIALGFMEEKHHFTFNGRIRSIGYACEGIWLMLRTQHNAWIHLAFTLAVIIAGLFFQITAVEWALLTMAIASVWVAESLNTAFEFLCDVSSPDFHPLVKKAKDVSAGAVLICAAGAVVIGAFVFIPHLLEWINSMLR